MSEPRSAEPTAVSVSDSRGVVVGDYATVFQSFGQAPRPLRDLMRVSEFRTLIEERTRAFVGRGFAFDAVARFLDDPATTSGYVVIRGEPGIGKTALAGKLVKQHGWVHHFNSAPLGIRSAAAFLSNVCAQLVVRYGLEHTALPPEATQDGGYLLRLLDEAAQVPEHRPVVVVIDALDEAEDLGVGADANRLFLPPVLPEGVFFIVTTREEYDYRLFVDPRSDLFLREDDPANLADVRLFIERFVAANQAIVADRIAGWKLGIDEFVDVLVAKSEGNFMYLVHALRDLRDPGSAMSADGPDALPQGLRAYYRRHWQVMRGADPDRFRLYAEPTVCLLATVREPVSVPEIVSWVRQFWGRRGWDDRAFEPRGVRDVIDDWHEFLNTDTVGGVRQHRVYHASFADFLRDEVGLTAYHEAISEAALSKIPGFLDAG